MKRILPVLLILAVALLPIPVYAETDDTDATHRIFMPAAGMVRPRAFVLSDAQSLASRGYGVFTSSSAKGLTLYSYDIDEDDLDLLSDAERYIVTQGYSAPTVVSADENASDLSYEFDCLPGQSAMVTFFYYGKFSEYYIEWAYTNQFADFDDATRVGWTTGHFGRIREFAYMPPGHTVFAARLVYLGPVAFKLLHGCLPLPEE